MLKVHALSKHFNVSFFSHNDVLMSRNVSNVSADASEPTQILKKSAT